MWDEIEQALGARVLHTSPAPWGNKNSTLMAKLANGRDIVVQSYRDPDAGARRLGAMDALCEPLGEIGVRIPRLLVGGAGWAAFDRIPGEVAYSAVGDDLAGASWSRIAEDMGRLARSLHQVDVSVLELNTGWLESDRRTTAALQSLDSLLPYLSAHDAATANELVRASASNLDAQASLCHGDFGPQNVLVECERVTGLLDFEDVRLAHPLLDTAWWIWLVRTHTPHAFSRGWPGYAAAAGTDLADDDPLITTLIVLRLLETADEFRRTQPSKYPSWGRRLSELLNR